jgi:VWA domain-containing protein
MIAIHCTNCRTLLEIDDAFAGGACRCRFCGTIQTVPSTLKKAVAGGRPGAKSDFLDIAIPSDGEIPSPRTLYKGRTRETGSGLDELAEVVAGSGLEAASQQPSRNRPATTKVRIVPAPKPALGPRLLAIGIIGLLAFISVVLAICIILNRTAASSNAANAVNAAPAQPQFCGVVITGKTVVYLLDRGSASRDYFDELKEATARSVQSLGPERQFQVLMWDNGTKPAGFPLGGPTPATPSSVSDCRRILESIDAYNQSTIDAPLAKAVSGNPDVIIIATPKVLDDSFVDQVRHALGAHPIVIDAFSLGLGSDSAPLASLARVTGGQYRVLSAGAMSAGG